MIIFGWGHQTIKNFGVTFKQQCPRCNNNDYWQLVKSTIWFTLFFIPLIPYEQKYFLLCPVCENGIKLENDKIFDLKNLAEANSDLINHKITEQEYHQRLGSSKALNNSDDNNNKYIEGTISEEKTNIKKEENVKKIKNSTLNKYCGNCGKEINNNSSFCHNCGIKLN